MTGEKFNNYQIEKLQESFDLVNEEIEKNYRKSVEHNEPISPYEGNTLHWKMLKTAVNDFSKISNAILDNELLNIDIGQWQEIMFLVETVNYEFLRKSFEKSKTLRMGLTLLIGMFRNQFPGEQWNPYEVRWTTVGEAGERGISPMLMAIAEL